MSNDPKWLEEHINADTLQHVDLSNVVGQTSPFILETASNTVSIDGGTGDCRSQALTSINGIPAGSWFGDQAESAFVVANGGIQMMSSKDIDAIEMTVTDIKAGQMVRPTTEGNKFSVAVFDSSGNMINNQSIWLNSGSNVLGIVSDVPFHSAIVLNTSDNWMFSNLNYATTERNGTIDIRRNSAGGNSNQISKHLQNGDRTSIEKYDCVRDGNIQNTTTMQQDENQSKFSGVQDKNRKNSTALPSLDCPSEHGQSSGWISTAH